jgi:hypothetical protein
MSTDHILSLLIAERDKLNRAIEALQGPARRRGRPPKNPLMTAATLTAPRRRRMGAAARKAVSARMKKYWAAKRKKQAKG